MKLPQFVKAIVLGAFILQGGGTSAETCKIEKKAELNLGYTNGLATVSAKINGTTVVMGLDTGAQSLVTPEVAEQLHLTRGLRRAITRGATAVSVTDQVILRDFEFAGTHYNWKTVPKIKLPALKVPGFSASPAAGLIGMDVLANYDLVFDFPNRKLTLHTVKNCATLPPPDFTDVRVIPFKFNYSRNIFFPIELDGKKLTAILDTGAGSHAITRAGIKKSGVTEAMLKGDPLVDSVGVGDISLKARLHKFSRLTIGGVESSSAQFGVLNKTLIEGDALIGQVYLFTRRIWISNATRTLYVENKPPVFTFASQVPGLPTLIPRAGTPNAPVTLEEICKNSALLRLQDFCAKRGDVPAEALDRAAGVPPAAPHAPAPPAAVAAAPAWPGVPQLAGEARAAPSSAPLWPYYRDPQWPGSGVIGADVIGISSACGEAMGLPAGAGALVRGFSTGSTGEKAGLRRGDIIRALDGQPITAVSSFFGAIHMKSPGQTVKLAVWRDRAETTLEAEVTDTADAPADKLGPAGRVAYQIEGGKAVLGLLPEDGCVQERGISLLFLGSAYNRGAVAASAPNDYEHAIKYLEEAVSRLDSARFRNWAIAQTELGTAYRLRSAGDKSANIQRAIRAYEEAISVQNGFVTGNERGHALMGLALALLRRGSPVLSEDIERAIECIKLAQEAFDSKVSPKDRVELHRALAEAYSSRSVGERQQNISQAITALEIALGVLGLVETGAAERSAVLARLTELMAQRAAAPAATGVKAP